MAGEQKGKAYEALTKLVLEDLKAAGTIKGRIFWDEKPDSMTIVPDLTVGRSSNAPEIVFLINHSGAAGNSHMKAWRNMGELAEAKILLPILPRVFSLAFDSVIKPDLKKVQAASFDGQLIVGDRPYGRSMQKWIDRHVSDMPTEKEEKVNYLRGLLGTDNELKKLFEQLKADLIGLVAKSSGNELEGLWKDERARKSRVPPKCKTTRLRRGIAKLALFHNATDILPDGRLSKRVSPTLVESLLLGGVLSRTVAGPRVKDKDILWAVASLPKAELSSLHIKARALDRVNTFAALVAGSARIEMIHAELCKKPTILTDKRNFARTLKLLHDDPEAIIDWKKYSVSPPETIWLLEYALDIFRVVSGLRSSFGYAQLGRAVQAAGYNSPTGAGNPRVWGGGYAIISDWVLRRDTENMPDEAIDGIADVLSARLAGISLSKLDPREMRKSLLTGIIENRLPTYSSIDPIGWLIFDSLPGASLVRLRGAFGQFSGLGGQAGQIEVATFRKTLLNWQSCSDAGRDHKKKELCGRAVALRYSWDAIAKKFIRRPGIEKLILVLDGTWRQSDLDTLVRAGWDEIFYPDEMDKLTRAIV